MYHTVLTCPSDVQTLTRMQTFYSGRLRLKPCNRTMCYCKENRTETQQRPSTVALDRSDGILSILTAHETTKLVLLAGPSGRGASRCYGGGHLENLVSAYFEKQ